MKYGVGGMNTPFKTLSFPYFQNKLTLIDKKSPSA